MNELVNDLYQQARLDAGHEKGFEATVQDVYQRFAQLIVRECMKLNSQELSITAIERLLPMYREHFGVEE
jgi:hypothetical protein